jgi:molybdopterin-guanine dinucleotide biosynthesis protein A
MASAAILAGGQARRFGGRDKSRLVIGGLTIFERQVTQLSQITDDILVVGAAKAARARARVPVRLVPDRVKDCGPLGGLDAALASSRDGLVVLIACDMPFVTAGFLQYLISFAQDVDAVVPRTSRGYHPLCAVYTRACQPAVQARLAARRLSMSDLLSEVRVRVVKERDIEPFGRPDDLLANVNSPAELHELVGLSGHQT